MKFDIARAWKDDTYCQALSREQREALPVHPSGELELSDHELNRICGGAFGLPAIGAAASSAATRKTNIHSFAVVCEINIYSIDLRLLGVNVLQIGNSHSQICIRQE